MAETWKETGRLCLRRGAGRKGPFYLAAIRREMSHEDLAIFYMNYRTPPIVEDVTREKGPALAAALNASRGVFAPRKHPKRPPWH